MRYLAGYLTFIALRLALTIVVGWVAFSYVRAEFETVADGLRAITEAALR